jgi:hypothetical protein
MKTNIVLLSLIILTFSAILSSCKNEKVKNPGATFRFENFQFSTKGLYSDIDQSSIKAIEVSFRGLSDTSAANSFLFNPEIRNNNHISLIDLIFWAIEDKGLTVYDLFSDYFTQPLKPEDIKQILKLYSDFKAARSTKVAEGQPADTGKFHPGITNYLLMESTIYGKDNKVISIRPVGLCPYLIQYDDQVGRFIRRPLFWVYFPDIMPLLSNYIPDLKGKDIKTTLDFFTKNMYSGIKLSELNYNTPLLNEKVPGDTLHYVQGFDVAWLYDHLKVGMYIDPYNKLFQGYGKQIQPLHTDIASEPELNLKLISVAKNIDNTINLRSVENYPLYFPEIPHIGQKSLIDILYEGIKEGKITVYSTSDRSTQLSIPDVETALGKRTLKAKIRTTGDKEMDTIISIDFVSSDVKKYIIKEIEFFDAKGNLTGSRVNGLIPIRETVNEKTGQTIFKELFFVPLNNQETRKIMASNYAYRFTVDDNISFLTFLQQKKYKVESVKTTKVLISNALKEIGIK